MKYKILIALSCIVVFILLFRFCSFPSNYSPSKKQLLANQVRDDAARKIEAEKNIYLIGTSGQMLYEIEMLGLSFQCFKEIDIEEARRLVVYAVQTLVTEVNQNKEIRSFLKNYPFSSKNVEIRIYCVQPNGENVFLHKLEYISSINGTIKYYPRGPDKHKMEEPIHTETYEEAVSIINKKEIEPLIGSNENLKPVGINAAFKMMEELDEI